MNAFICVYFREKVPPAYGQAMETDRDSRPIHIELKVAVVLFYTLYSILCTLCKLEAGRKPDVGFVGVS